MRIARRQSYRSTSRRPWERVRRKNPCPHRILALRRKKRRKKRRKSGENRGGEITPMRLRRSLFFVKPATLAGRPSRRKPQPRRAAPHETRITAFMAVRFAVSAKGSHHQKPPPGPLHPPTSHCFTAHFRAALRGIARQSCCPVTASLLTSAHYCPELLGIARGGGGGAPEQVSAHRPPFSVGLTTSAVSRSSRRPPGSLRCGQGQMNPC